MKGFFDNIKISMVFVGTVIGAGFATGREIAMYFGSCSMLTTVFGGIACGIMVSIFMQIGAKKIAYIPNSLKKVFMFVGSTITLLAMVAASGEILGKINIAFGGVLALVFALIIASKSNEVLKNINTIIIVAVIILVGILLFKCDSSYTSIKEFSPIRALAYGGMNMLLVTELAESFGKDKTNKDIAVIGIMTSIIISILLIAIRLIIMNYELHAMPLIAKASTMGLTIISVLVVFGAIFTTLLSAVKLLKESLELQFKKKDNAIYVVFIMGVAGLFLSFYQVVDIGYSLLSVMGLICVILGIIASLRYYVKN